MEKKRVDIIVLSWNGKKHLEVCLPSLQQQTYKQFRVLVVENGSKPEMVQWTKEKFPWVTVLELKENIGFTGGNIVGYQASTAEYVVLLNNDTKPKPDWLEKLVHAADTHPDVGIVASVLIYWDKDIIDSAGDRCTFAGTGYKASNGKRLSEISSGYVFGACAGAALYKREMLNQIGFFDDAFFLNQEDTDISFRAQLAGWKVWLEADAHVYHRVTATIGKSSSIAVFHGSKNTELVFWKNMPLALIPYAFIHKFIQNCLSIVRLILYPRLLLAYVNGKIWAIRNFHIILKKRSKVQNLKRVNTLTIAHMLDPVISKRYFLRNRLL